MNLVKFSNRFFSVAIMIILLIMLTECTKDIENSNQKPSLNVNSVIDGLNLSIKVNAVDSDGTISTVIIDWGDTKTDKFVDGNFTNLEADHKYAEPANYNIIIAAVDNEGDSTAKTISLTVDFEETSLASIKPSMFKTSENEYLILTINLHTYQEAQQNEKFNKITDVIGKLDVDFIAFQECAQNKSAVIFEGIIREDNMALIISDRLKEKYNADYNFVWHWSHYGWTIWEEGVAIMSKHPLLDTDERYVSSNTSTGTITSRKVIYGSYQIPQGVINIFSAHTHWRTSLTDEEQNNQIENIKIMVDEKDSSSQDIVSFVCGDFNSNPTSDYPWSEGYNTMMNNGDYLDTFLEIYPDANNTPAQSIYNTIGGDFPGRIDYIFMKDNVRFNVEDSQIIFKNSGIGTISDHYGVITKVSLTN